MMKLAVPRFVRRLVVPAMAVASTWLLPVLALADEPELYDARIENYNQKVALEPNGTALTWFLLALLAALCIGVMFKSANRSHLD